jgi:hypothetical protein
MASEELATPGGKTSSFSSPEETVPLPDIALHRCVSGLGNQPATFVRRSRRSALARAGDTSYEYNLGGLLTKITYPSNRSITYTYSNAMRLLKVQDLGNSIWYAMGTCGPSSDGACYAAHGGLNTMILGKVDGGFTGITNTYSYNNRLQPSAISATSTNGTVLDLSYAGWRRLAFCASLRFLWGESMVRASDPWRESKRRPGDRISRSTTATGRGNSLTPAGRDYWACNPAFPDASFHCRH